MEQLRPDDPLTAALRRLAAEDAAQETSEAVRMRLLAEVRQRRLARRRSLATMAMIAAGLVVLTAFQIWQLATLDRGSSLSAGHVVSAPAEGELVTAFFPLAYSSIPMSAGRLVRLAVPREAMVSFGIEEPAAEPGEVSDLVLAEVMVGEDGLARAVRFVRPLTSGTRKDLQR
jgi:hypothetical protein